MNLGIQIKAEGLILEDPNAYADVIVFYTTILTSNPSEESLFFKLVDHLHEQEIQEISSLLEKGKIIDYNGANSSPGEPKIGFLSFERIEEEKGGIYPRTFYPLGHSPEKDIPQFLGKGIADKIELNIINHLIGYCGENSHIKCEMGHTHKKFKERRRAMGFEQGKIYTLQQYHSILSSKKSCQQFSIGHQAKQPGLFERLYSNWVR